MRRPGLNKIVLIVSCAAVTLLPRIIPYFASSALSKLPRFLRKCMMLLPVAALGALIFPLALTDFSSQWYAGLVGVAAAFICSLLKGPMILSIIIALISTTLMLLV